MSEELADEGRWDAVARWAGQAFAEEVVAVTGVDLLSLGVDRQAQLDETCRRVLARARLAFTPEAAHVLRLLLEENWGVDLTRPAAVPGSAAADGAGDVERLRKRDVPAGYPLGGRS